MDEKTLQNALKGLSIGPLRYFDSIGSTNDEAAAWLDQGAPDLSVVIANEQTRGRGREGRAWYSPAGDCLALSVVLRLEGVATHILPRLTGLGALAVQSTLTRQFGLPSQIKWPNDVLFNRRKIAGVLVETSWSGDQLIGAVLGIGVNIAPGSVQFAESQETLRFPATCVAWALERPVELIEVLQPLLGELIYWKQRLSNREFLQAWDSSLAFRGETVEVSGGTGLAPAELAAGKILDLSQDGSLRLRSGNGEIVNVRFGEVRLRPVP